MNFHFNEEEQEILDMLHDYAVKEVAPRAHEIDEEEKFPMEARNFSPEARAVRYFCFCSSVPYL